MTPFEDASSGEDDPLVGLPAVDAGDAFEQKCWNLLRRRYPPAHLVYLPADMGGDCGIEGFSTDGIAYQCYADRDSASLRHRTDKQKSKLYDDTAKLKKYASRLEKVLDGLMLESYFLMVPEYHAVELIEYANTRAKAVRDYGLSFISPNFSVRIKTPQDYPAELKAAVLDAAAKATVGRPNVTDTHVDLFPSEKPDLVLRLDEKLAVLQENDPGTDVVYLRGMFIRAFLAKEQLMASFENWPDTRELIEVRRQLRQSDLELESELSADGPSRRLMSLIKDYRQDLIDKVAGVSETDAHSLALGQTGEWLMRCPLRFRRTL